MKSLSLKPFLTLIKFKVSIAVTFTAITGYIVFAGKFDIQLLQLAIGVFLLASGSSALNEVQESNYDARMPRTKMRPIPTGEMSRLMALIISLALIFEGLYLLLWACGEITFLLGVFNVFWYNGLYTNLKRITAYAVVPGSMVGAIPVLMGWTAAGGYVFSFTIIYIGLFLFIWQVPHFWLLMLKYGKEYEDAGFPVINNSFQPQSLKIIIFTWIVATSVTSILIPLFLTNLSWFFFVIVFVLNLVFIGFFVKLAFGKAPEIDFRKSFISINIYMMLFMIMLIVFHLATVN